MAPLSIIPSLGNLLLYQLHTVSDRLWQCSPSESDSVSVLNWTDFVIDNVVELERDSS